MDRLVVTGRLGCNFQSCLVFIGTSLKANLIAFSEMKLFIVVVALVSLFLASIVTVNGSGTDSLSAVTIPELRKQIELVPYVVAVLYVFTLD